MAELNTLSPVEASNNAAPPEGAPEGWVGADVNLVVRELMAKLARYYTEIEWVELTYQLPTVGTKTFTRISDTQLQINNCDARNNVLGGPGFNSANRRIQILQGATAYYGFITSATYSAPHTTVNVLMDNGVVPATIDSCRVHVGARLARVAFVNSLLYLDDDSANDAAQDVQTATGTYAARSLAIDLTGELRRLRYAVSRQAIGVGTLRNSGASSVGWIEKPARGRNLLRNGRFARWNGTAGSVPSAWSLSGTPTTLETVARATAAGIGREVHVVADAANEGVSQAVQNLRANTLYLVRVRCRVAATRSVVISTTGGSGSIWGNHSQTITSTSDTDSLGVVLTDGTPTDIVVRIRSAGAGDEFWASEAEFIPIGDSPIASEDWECAYKLSIQRKVTAETITTGAWAPPTNLGTLPIFVPSGGGRFRISVEAVVTGAPVASANRTMGVRLTYQLDGGGYLPLPGGPVAMSADHPDRAQTVSLFGEIDIASAGKYEFRVEVQPVGGDWYVCPNVATLGQLESWIAASIEMRNA